jgi:two-component system, NtrC family, nitrogen regulation sensor histidine kinase NtrY
MRKYIVLFFTAIILFAISDFLYSVRMRPYDAKSDIEKFQKEFYKKESIAKTVLNETVSLIKENEEEYIYEDDFLKYAENIFEKENIALFISNEKSLLFWSNNKIPVTLTELPNEIYGMDNNKNGYYYFIQNKSDDLTIWAYILIKKNYKYQNRFLQNKFQKDFCIQQNFVLSSNPALGFPVYSQNRNYAFSLVPDNIPEKTENRILWMLSLISAVLAIILMLHSLFLFLNKNKFIDTKNTAFKIVFLLSFLFAIRFVLLYFKVPEILYSSKMFSPGLYASSSFLPSLGDLFLHVLFFCLFVFYLYKNSLNFHINRNFHKTLANGFNIVLFLTIILFAMFIMYLTKTLVINSQLQLNVNLINEINLYNITGLLIIGLLFFTLYFLSILILRIIVKSAEKKLTVFVFYLAAILISISIWKLFFNSLSWLWILLSLFPLIHLFYKNKKSEISNRFSALVISLFLFCLTITTALIVFNKNKELELRKTLALSLSLEQDPIAEFLFNEIEDDLYKDYGLINLVAKNPYDLTNISGYLQKRYFSDYWAKYDMQLTVCTKNEKLIVKPSNIEVDCTFFFEDYINAFGKQTLSDRLIFLDNNTGRSSYIAVIPIEVIFAKEWEADQYNLFLEFDSKFVPRDLGFPELLIDEGVEFPSYLNIYSYAVYRNKALINKFGPFFYSINSAVYGEFDEVFSVFNYEKFSHLHFSKDEEIELIVSKSTESALEKIAPFSYLFILYFIILLIYWGLTRDVKSILYFKINFKSRLQASMIGIVLVSLISIAAVSAWFIYNIYTNNNKAIISEKAYSVLSELENQMIEAQVLNSDFEYYLNDVLIKLSNVFYTDINVYSSEGLLMGSSRNRVFDEGLISELMNPQAYLHLKGQKQILFIHHEKIGNLEYLSAYLPLRNQNNELLAYINLPYFAKHGELRSEISYFLVAFINIYLLLLVLAVVIAILISGYVTRPLQMLRDSISNIKLGNENKKIDWMRNDEIGLLVQEYNRMIDELTTSAELLAQSERESAWREMAKQVAHEIKNPLTPMKLSVQYLEKAWIDKVPNWDTRLKKFGITMIEQIDSLSEIASAFSDFAKMPSGKFSNLDLKIFIEEVIYLYKDFEYVIINLKIAKERKMIVFADKKQMLRVLNNLIKNALQAYGKNEIAKIDILLSAENGYYCIEVKDYGQGIEEDQKINIFKPYFTTKTAGLGLGLAMVKSIIESFGGEVAFKSKFGEGSSFFVKIPKA